MADPVVPRCKVAPRHCRSIEAQAAARLRNHSHFRGRTLDLTFQLQGDVLIIRGQVPSFYLKQLLHTVLREMENVSRIENYVDVISSDGVSSVRRQTNRPTT